MEQQYAVLTGDIVKSSRLAPGQLEALRRRLETGADDLNAFLDGLVIGRIDFFRGDGWQLLLARPSQALRAALFLRTTLIAFEDADTRVGIGIGPVETIDKANVSRSVGRAFERSGHALDAMKKRQRLDWLDDRPADRPDTFRRAVRLCDVLIRRLSPRQAEAVSWALRGLKQVEIAERMAIRQHSVAEYLVNAGWEEIREFAEKIVI